MKKLLKIIVAVAGITVAIFGSADSAFARKGREVKACAGTGDCSSDGNTGCGLGAWVQDPPPA